MYQRIARITTTLIVAGVVAGGGILTYQWGKDRIASDLYRDRLRAMHRDYEALRETYNKAVARTAVTELIVSGSQLDVVVRRVDGLVETIPTPFDPHNEIYIDYLVFDGRLWIRRIFDQYTPPSSGLTVDPALIDVDWSDQRVLTGKAIYHGGLTDGRWVVTSAGNGALGLSRVDDDEAVELSPPPAVTDFDEMERKIHERVDQVAVTDVISWAWRSLTGG